MRSTPEYSEAIHIILKLNLVSHAGAISFEASSRSAETSRTGNRPPGGLDWRDDREPDYRQKSAQHFQWRLGRCRTRQDVQMLLADAKDALDAWQKTPLGPRDPMPGDPMFRRWVIEHEATDSELARLTGVSRQYINRIRRTAQ